MGKVAEAALLILEELRKQQLDKAIIESYGTDHPEDVAAARESIDDFLQRVVNSSDE